MRPLLIGQARRAFAQPRHCLPIALEHVTGRAHGWIPGSCGTEGAAARFGAERMAFICLCGEATRCRQLPETQPTSAATRSEPAGRRHAFQRAISLQFLVELP